jgi:hypothetical protein
LREIFGDAGSEQTGGRGRLLQSPMPSSIRRFTNPVIKFLEAFANVVSRIVLTVLYFLLLTIPGVFVRFFQDPLGLRRRSGSNFSKKRDVNPDLAHARKQG